MKETSSKCKRKITKILKIPKIDVIFLWYTLFRRNNYDNKTIKDIINTFNNTLKKKLKKNFVLYNFVCACMRAQVYIMKNRDI